MSEVIPFTSNNAVPVKIRIGLLRLTDSAPVIVAHEFGFFADEGVEAELIVEPSWANIADKLSYGFFDAAIIVPPLAFAVQLGLRGVAQPLLIPYTISSGGNTVTLSQRVAEEVKDLAARHNLTSVAALAACIRRESLTLGIVHAYSTHNLLLRYWLATAGIEAGRDVKLTVVPPASAVEALTSGQIAGFCAGAPWGEVAQRAGIGKTLAISRDIWQNAPEKALAVRAHWAEGHAEILGGALRALLRAAKFCDDPKNASYIAALLSRRKYLNVDSHAILVGLPRGSSSDRGCVFFRGAATFPWRSHGLWFLSEMRRWGLIDARIDLPEVAHRVYRPDLYRAIFGAAGEIVPAADWKIEGAHDAAWQAEAAPVPMTLPADRFCDGAIFDPDHLAFPAKPLSGTMYRL
ncbi:MAG TPA: CmpA/NrtA family ABC transporter substrate-binding protein [Methylocella sp.]|nr:CmpA/NrtA family ABC transporter substrate-binding protein [Methylocella sp.]